MPEPTNVQFFRNAAAFRKWLQKNHATTSELWVGFYRKDSGKTAMSYPEAVDQALCFGWIDGIRKALDEVSYVNRFTPRRKSSVWSAVNLKRVRALQEAGLLAPAGLKAFEERDEAKTNRYSFERENVQFSPQQLARFRKRKRAWAFFEAQPPSYRRLTTWWVVSARQPATQQRRLDRLIADSAAGLRIAELRPAARKKS